MPLNLNKEQKAMFLVASRLNVHFGFDHKRFASPIGRATEVALPKIQTPTEKCVHPCDKPFLYQVNSSHAEVIFKVRLLLSIKKNLFSSMKSR